VYPHGHNGRVAIIDGVISSCEHRMHTAIDVLKRELGGIRAGRANPTLVERITVEYYGTATPLSQLATVSVPEPRVLVIQPWDKTQVGAVAKAIQKSDLGITPSSDANVVRLVIPPLTEERRRELVKQVHRRAEEAKVAIRNCRRDAQEDLRKLQKEQHLSEDDVKRSQERLQKLTDGMIAQVDDTAARKEREVQEV
jgi:ribosome recycling factor